MSPASGRRRAWPVLLSSSISTPGAWRDGRCKTGRGQRSSCKLWSWHSGGESRRKGADPFGSGPPLHQHGPGRLASPAHNLAHSTSRRGTCHDHAVARASSTRSSERITRRTCRGHEKARKDGFDDIEMFCHPKRKHASNGMLSPVGFERRQMTKRDGVQGTRGCSHVVRGSEKRLLPTCAK